jgi:hypothetical protein
MIDCVGRPKDDAFHLLYDTRDLYDWASRPDWGQSGRPEQSSAALQTTAAPRPPTSLEAAVLDEINAARTDPHAYAHRLRPAPYVDISDAAAFLTGRTSIPPLTDDSRLAGAAIAHADDQGPKGGESHTGSDGSRPSERMRGAGVQTSEYAEVISIGYPTAPGVVQQLLVDQPGPNHPHRDDLFDPNLAVAGVGCGPSTKFVTICVIDLASSVAPPSAPVSDTAAAIIGYGVLDKTINNLRPAAPAPGNPFGPPMAGARVRPDGSWSMTFSDGSTATYRTDGTVHIVFPEPGQGLPAPPGAPPPDGPQVPPPPITDSAMKKVLDAYEQAHPIEGATTEEHISVEDDGSANSATLSWFSHGAEIYRAEFDGQGKLKSAGQTPEGRSLDTMKKFDFAYYSGEHGITAASIGRTPEGLSYLQHVSFTDESGGWRGFMDFDQTGALTKGLVYKADGDVLARWDGPPEALRQPAHHPKTLDDVNDELDQEAAAQKAADLKAWREQYPPQAVSP